MKGEYIYMQAAVLWAKVYDYLNEKNIPDRLVKFEFWKMRIRICGIQWASYFLHLPYLLIRLRKSVKVYLQSGSDVLNRKNSITLAAVQCMSMLVNKSCNLHSIQLLGYWCHHFIRVNMTVFLSKAVWTVQVRLSVTMHKTAKNKSGDGCELT